jgi:hypothetical protein
MNPVTFRRGINRITNSRSQMKCEESFVSRNDFRWVLCVAYILSCSSVYSLESLWIFKINARTIILFLYWSLSVAVALCTLSSRCEYFKFNARTLINLFSRNLNLVLVLDNTDSENSVGAQVSGSRLLHLPPYTSGWISELRRHYLLLM